MLNNKKRTGNGQKGTVKNIYIIIFFALCGCVVVLLCHGTVVSQKKNLFFSVMLLCRSVVVSECCCVNILLCLGVVVLVCCCVGLLICR